MILPVLFRILPIVGLMVLAACGAPAPSGAPGAVARADVAALEAAILALGPEVDPEEAARAARITYEYTAQLVDEYQIVDPPLVHNTKVNMGLKPRGLCWHWAEDIENRLAAEQFETLDLHRAIANANNIRIEHSTAIVSRKGDGMYDGIVLDPWRYGGVVYWGGVTEDPKYDWYPQAQVHAEKRARALARARRGPAS